MIACISLSRLGSKLYTVHVDEVPAQVVYASIAEALADHVDIPSDYAQYVNIEFHGVRLATLAVSELRPQVKELAAELVRMAAEIHRHE